jgi:hypothetical protein
MLISSALLIQCNKGKYKNVVTYVLEVSAASIFRGYPDDGERFYFAVLVTAYISTWCHNPECLI